VHRSALNAGDKVVDATVTSVHKNLGGLSATALINVGIDSWLSKELIVDIYNMQSTTSPSPFLLLDAECCIRKFID